MFVSVLIHDTPSCHREPEERRRGDQLHGLLRRCAPPNEHVFVITSLAPPGVVIQLDGHGAERLAMTLSGSLLPSLTQAPLVACSR